MSRIVAVVALVNHDVRQLCVHVDIQNLNYKHEISTSSENNFLWFHYVIPAFQWNEALRHKIFLKKIY